jgi:tRNA dimethylallyltransferase
MEENRADNPIYVIAGPTASGKTALAVKLALAVGGEAVNFDSVQIYREIEIATAKPTEEERQGVPHHLIDYVDPRINYTAAAWAADARKVIENIESKGRSVVLVGGTGFYLRTLMNPLFESPKTDETLRGRLRTLKDKRGPEHLHKMLTRVDPEAAAGLPAGDYIRVMRALEVFFQTGKRISEVRERREEPPDFVERMKIFVLDPPRDQLYAKINARAESHFSAGLVDEVAGLRERGISDDTNALGAHGYRRVCEYLRGERTLPEAVEKTKQDVRNYAKRQFTWFRREKGAIWLSGFGHDEEVWHRLKDHIP